MSRISPDLAGQPVIIGAGIAGLMVALHMAPEPVVVLAKAPLGDGVASGWSQGGIAAAIAPDDTPALHQADTLAAGDGLCDEEAVARIVEAAPSAIEDLIRRGVRFDRRADGTLLVGLEAAHSRHRILHAGGDTTGAEIMRALVDRVRETSSITVLDGLEARRLMLEDGAISGVLATGDGASVVLPTRRVVIATGGLGGLYRHTSNPLGALGQGIALAARAGAVLADMEFVQFHPTALDVGLDPMPLISEAVRGEGAILIDETGTRFMEGLGRAELEPRDVVARAVWRHLGQGHRVYLDARAALGAGFAARFPGIHAKCLAAGIDPSIQPIPIHPAAHYHMGGISVDATGASSIEGLWVCGEAAATGLHGANRLGSNSLIEAAVSAVQVAQAVAGAVTLAPAKARPVILPPGTYPMPVRGILSRHVGVLRDEAGLKEAIRQLRPLAAQNDAAMVGLLIAVPAYLRTESRGGHCRVDHPKRADEWARRLRLTLAEVESIADRILGAEAAARNVRASL